MPMMFYEVKAWHYTSAVKVSHFEWLAMCTGETGLVSVTKANDNTLE